MAGRLGGRIMARTNVATERRCIELAELTAEAVVLVIGPGPGVGLRLAAEVADHGQVTGVDPSQTMLDAAARRCADLVLAGRVLVQHGTAADTGQANMSIDVVISVNNVMFWPDRDAGFAELHRVLHPGGRLVLSAHQRGLRWADTDIDQLAAEAERAGFTNVLASVREHAGMIGPAAELLATRPA